MSKDSDDQEVQLAIRGLLRQSHSASVGVISDPEVLRGFQRHYLQLGQCLKADYEKGKITKDELLDTTRKERRSLLEQSTEITLKGIGVVAGGFQIAAGAGTCYFSAGTLCAVVGAPLILHGGNNIYENSMNLWDDSDRHTGYVRKAYQGGAELMGFPSSYGDIAYYGVDLGLSVSGMMGASTKIKPASNAFKDSKQLVLFKSANDDYLRGYQAASKFALGTEGFADSISLDAIRKSMKDE